MKHQPIILPSLRMILPLTFGRMKRPICKEINRKKSK